VKEAYSLLFSISFLGFSNLLFAKDLDTYPKDWGQLSNERIAESDCPSLEGSYYEKGLVYQTIDGKEVAATPEASSSRITPGNFLKTISNSEDIDFYLYSFTIVQKNPEGFEVIRLGSLKDTYSIVTVNLDSKIDDFSCNNGWVVYKPIVYKGGSEGYSMKSNYEAKLTKLLDGSLLFYFKEKTSRRDMLIFNQTRHTEEYIKYLPSNPNPSFKRR
jgi:hypothetical protein